MTRAELKQALKDSKLEPGCAVRLSNGWYVVTQRIYPQPARVGPAWHYLYSIISPTGKRFGGRERMDSMVSYFTNPIQFQWRDDYRVNGIGDSKEEQA